MSDRVVSFLREFPGTLAVSYDRKADLSHLQALISQASGVAARVRLYDIAKETSSPASKSAWSAQLDGCAPRGIGQHHALAEALALKAAWFATPE